MLKLIASQKTGKMVNNFTTVGKDGIQRAYVIARSTKRDVQENGWLFKQIRQTLFKGTVEECLELVNDCATNGMIVPVWDVAQLDVLENEIRPVHIQKFVHRDHIVFDNNDKPIAIKEEFVDNYVKRPWQDGPALTKGGLRIFRFLYIDKTGMQPDIKIAHDNIDEVTAARKDMIALKNSGMPPANNPKLENEADKLQAFLDTAPTMTVPELKEYAQANGINIGNVSKAPKLIEIITEALTPVTTE